MKQRHINATLKRTLPPIAALALTTLLILTVVPQSGTAAPDLERQPLESLTELNSTEATEGGVPLSTTTSVPIAPNGLAGSPWSMFQHDSQRTGRSQYIGPQTNTLNWTFPADTNNTEEIYYSPVIDSEGTVYFIGGNNTSQVPFG